MVRIRGYTQEAPKMSAQTMRLPLAAFLMLLGCAGCSQPGTTVPAWRNRSSLQSPNARTKHLREKLKTVSVADGISKSEAFLIAERYFHQHVGCGGITGIRDGGGYWIADGASGYAAQPIRGFHIDKRTGRIMWPIVPRHAAPFEIREAR